VAATEKKPTVSALFVAAMALPVATVLPGVALAGSAPEQTSMGFKYLDYKDYQRSGDRIKIVEPMIWLDAPLTSDLQLQANVVVDTITGASPVFQNTLVSGIEDRRRAGDVKLTKYFDDFSVAAGVAASKELDYESRSVNLETRIDFNQKNTTLALGVGLTRDKIGSTVDPTLDERRRSTDVMVGVTQIIDSLSLVQTNLALSWGQGFYSDAYKALDTRPDERRQAVGLVRYVRYVPKLDGALHADYRYFTNDWGVRAHTFDFSWYQNVGESWKVIPGLRYYSQQRADFYSTQFPPTAPFTYFSTDQRLSTFGGITTSLKVSKNFAYGWQADMKYEFYRQDASLHLGGEGSPGVEPFYARAWTFGISRSF